MIGQVATEGEFLPVALLEMVHRGAPELDALVGEILLVGRADEIGVRRRPVGGERRRLVRDQHRQLACDVELLVRSEEHTSELQSLMRSSYAVFCLKNKKLQLKYTHYIQPQIDQNALHRQIGLQKTQN